jgi:Domain of unknown function (DUF6362)
MDNIRLPQIKLPQTTQEIALWFEEAMRTGRKLPPVGPRGYVTLWPEFKRTVGDEKHFFPPTGAAIDRMLECTRWLEWIDAEDRGLIWQRAKREPWKEICAALGCDRTTAWRRLNSALRVILEHLERRQGKASSLDRELLETLAIESPAVSPG